MLFAAKGLNPGGGQFPVVVVTGAIFPFVELFVRDTLAGEMLYRLQNRLVKGFVDIDENAVDVEDD